MTVRGEVYWVDHRGSVGAEIRKVRPAVIVSNDRHNRHSETVTVVPLSSGEPKAWFDEVPIPPGMIGDGRRARLKAYQVRAVDKTRLGRKIGVLPEPVMAALASALRVHLGIGEPDLAD